MSNEGKDSDKLLAIDHAFANLENAEMDFRSFKLAMVAVNSLKKEKQVDESQSIGRKM